MSSLVKKAYYIFIFQKKILLPAIIISVLLGFIGHSMNGKPISTNTGLAYLFILPLFQFFVYELRYAHEYYFYYNLGISKLALWVACIAQALVFNLVTSLL
ncbi:hypothetical protein [Tunicatimonas pelagia]|uniref:hypothetical protein n=1 Tax=Tunicatimonas pelagia TaxID=931531 RepID=UPI002666DCB9|nr:hypothetical protein [Tunicatimonas pelagia]WKN44746.1 hypothetical protein P0M28_07185 [Tunicatimonas pelagia]